MKSILIAIAMITAATTVSAADVGVSISVGQPGFYGQIDIGNFPRPEVINTQPVIIERRSMDSQPVYLLVPPGHVKHWKKHCHEYHACGKRVYFVQDKWYNHEYVPRYQAQHRDHRNERHDNHRNDHHERHRDDRRNDDRDNDRRH